MSLPLLVIGTKNLSSWSLRAWLALKHLAVQFDEIELPLDTTEYHTRIREYSPTGRVPALVHGEVRLWDSLAICEYANELAGGRGWPGDRGARAHARSISAEMHSGFQGLRTCWPMAAGALALNVPLTADALDDVKRIQEIWTGCRKSYAGSGPWLFGNFSIADAMFAPVVLRFNSYGAQLSEVAHLYAQTVLGDAHVRGWIRAAQQ